MAYVSGSTASGSGPSFTLSSSVNAGDILVVSITGNGDVNSGYANVSRWNIPAGWHRVGMWDGGSGGSLWVSFGLAIFWTRATSGGTVTATFSWPGDWYGLAHISRWSGMESVGGVAAQRVSGRSYTYPGVTVGQPAPTGHALRYAVTDVMAVQGYDWDGKISPPGHTERANLGGYTYVMKNGQWLGSHGAILSEQSLTAVVPAQATRNTGTLTVSGWGITVYLASAYGPPAPTITSPSAGEAVKDLSAAWTLAWTPDGEQTGARITRQSLDSSGNPTGSVSYLTSISSPAWSTSATTLTTTATEVDFDAGDWNAAGARYRITVATVGDATRPSLGPAATRDVESWQDPVASNPTVGGSLVGGVIINRAPWMTVDGTPGSGATIDRHEVQVVDSTTGEVYAGGTYGPSWWYEVPATEEDALPNGVTVTLRGRVRQRGVQWSPWVEDGPYLVDAPRPDAPTVTVGQTTHPTSGLPGLAVTVSSVAGRVTLYRDGELLDSWDSTGSLTIADYTPPNDTTVSYTATVTVGSPLPEESLPSAPVTSTLDPSLTDSWLIDPLNPADAVRVPRIDFTEKMTHPSSVYYPLTMGGVVHPIVQSLAPHAPSGTITFSIETHAQEAAVIRMLTSGRPLVYNRWPEYTYDPLCEVSVLKPLRFIPVGEITITHMKGNLQWRDISVGWVTAQ